METGNRFDKNVRKQKREAFVTLKGEVIPRSAWW